MIASKPPSFVSSRSSFYVFICYDLPICLHVNILYAFKALEAFKVQHNGKCFNLSHCYRVIKDEEKFKAQYTALKARGGNGAVEDVGEGDPARPRGKTNS